MATTTYSILLDTRFCTGCNTCFYKCVQENRLHDVAVNGNTRTLVQINDEGQYHHRCMHCQTPTCATNCPKKALTKSKYGPVLYDASLCVGCKTCVNTCPFKVPMYDEAKKQIVKCSMCAHRNLEQGKDVKPACVEACPTGALVFGETKAIVAQAKKIAADNKLTIYGLEENGSTSMLILTKADPYKIGYPKVEKKPPKSDNSMMGVGIAAGAAATAAAAYVGLKKYSERRNQVEKVEKK